MQDSSLPQDIQDKVNQWMHSPFDQATQHEIQNLLDHDKEKLMDAFQGNLSFGTAGMRGIMGAGTNRINIYTIRAATQGVCHYINETVRGFKSVVIGYDNRTDSGRFAMEAAKVFAGNHIKAFLSPDLRPTPYVSFICRNKKATAAVMITASHNPPEYNGYKVYWSDGAQVVAPHDTKIMEAVKKIYDFSCVKLAEETSHLIELLTEEDDKKYIEALGSLKNWPDLTEKKGSNLSIIYSPLHGTGLTLFKAALASWGFTNISYVEKQKNADPHFTYAKLPNPEEPAAMQLGIDLLKQLHADIFIATDPDADRIGACILNNHHPYLLTGNQIATLCVYHLLTTYQKQNRLSSHHAVISTIVSTRLLSKICSDFNVKYIDTLTGFKYIGEKIKLFEEMPDGFEFLFGAEESHGYLYGTYARDKDSFIASCLLCEIALIQKEKNKTLYNLLEEIYDKYGLYHEKQLSLKFTEDQEGLENMKNKLDHLRTHHPKDFLGKKIIKIDDYLNSYSLNLQTHTKEKIALPRSDVLSFVLEDDSRFIIRPSGTEPKIKIYAMTSSKEKEPMTVAEKKLDNFLNTMLSHIKDTYFSS